MQNLPLLSTITQDNTMSSDESEEDADNFEVFMKKHTKKKGSKTGRKSHWPTDMVNDLVDIIIEDENLKKKLLLTNIKNVKNSDYYKLVIEELKGRCELRGVEFPFDINQTRQKFKRCMTACREAALKIKTASGIQRFQEDKNFGTWFNKLFAVVKSMDSCQPEQSLEPDCAQAGVPSGSETTPPSSNETDNCPGNNKKRKLFVPIHETTKKAKTRREENITQGLCDINNALSNDPTEKILDFLKEESDRQQQRDDRFMALFIPYQF